MSESDKDKIVYTLRFGKRDTLLAAFYRYIKENGLLFSFYMKKAILAYIRQEPLQFAKICLQHPHIEEACRTSVTYTEKDAGYEFLASHTITGKTLKAALVACITLVPTKEEEEVLYYSLVEELCPDVVSQAESDSYPLDSYSGKDVSNVLEQVRLEEFSQVSIPAPVKTNIRGQESTADTDSTVLDLETNDFFVGGW